MAVDLMGHAFAPAAAAGEQVAFQEAAAAGLRSLELLASSLSPRASGQPPALGPIADQAVSRFRRVINLLDRTGHARFRRAPAVAPADYDSPPASPPPSGALSPVVSQAAVVVAAEVEAKPQKSLTLDFTKPAVVVAKAAAKAAPAVSATSTSFLSSVTAGGGGEGSVSKGQSLAAVSSGKPPLPKRKQHPCTTAAGAVPCSKTTAAAAAHPDQSAAPKCHCSKKRRKHARGATRTVRVPAPPASTASDIPADAFSWRKYGQKPIKGSPFPRGYYRCSTVKGCPARKHVERDADDPATLVVTYEGDHRHDAAAPALAGAGAAHNRRA